jgi:hypothetical protein
MGFVMGLQYRASAAVVQERGLTCFACILRQKEKVVEKERLRRFVLKMSGKQNTKERIREIKGNLEKENTQEIQCVRKVAVHL